MKYYIIAIILLLVMCFFLFLAVKAMTIMAGRKMHVDVNRMLAVYDRLLEKKSNQLTKLRKEKLELQATLMYVEPKRKNEQKVEFMNGIPASAEYSPFRSEGFVPVYRRIRETFGQGHMQEMQRVIVRCRAEYNETFIQEVISQLLMVSYEVRYQLSVLPYEDQESVISEVGPEGTKTLIRVYKMAKKHFDCLGFFQWLAERESEVGRLIHVYVARVSFNLSSFGENVVIHQDTSICEGFRIFCGAWFYDYSIGTRELGK